MDTPQVETQPTEQPTEQVGQQHDIGRDNAPVRPPRGEVSTGLSSEKLDTEADGLETLYGGGEVEPAPPSIERPDPSVTDEQLRQQPPGRDAPQLTAEDAQTLTALHYEAQNFERDLQDFATAKARLAEMEHTDPVRAKAYAPQVAVAERELRQRYEAIQGAAQQFSDTANTRRVESETASMIAAVPELGTSEGKAALRGDLLEHWGFTEQEIQVPDIRLVRMAWESLQYRQMMAGQSTPEPRPKRRTLPPPTKRRPVKKSPEKARFEQSIANFKAQHDRPPTKAEEAAIRIYGHGKADTFKLPRSTERDAADILYGKG